MVPSLLAVEARACVNSLGTLPIIQLLEQGIEYVQQERYIEGIALLTIVSEHLPPDRMDLVELLNNLAREYAKYSQYQQKIQELSKEFLEVSTEMNVITAKLSFLRSSLIIETNSEHITRRPEKIHSFLEQVPGKDTVANPILYAICLSPFTLSRLGTPIVLCSNRNSQTLLRYLIAQPDHSATVDTLMALLWPEDIAEVALRKLYVTVSTLRRALQTGSNIQGKYILYSRGFYQLDPSVLLHSDVEEFLSLYNAGCKGDGDMTVSYYERACSLYTQPFLMEDLYADWSFNQREKLRQTYLDMCSNLSSHYLEISSFEMAASWASVIVEEDSCNEAAYRQLMRIYTLTGRRSEAVRQYQLCQRVLADDLSLQPMPETVDLYQNIIHDKLK